WPASARWYSFLPPSGLPETHYATGLPGKTDSSVVDDTRGQEYQQFGFALECHVPTEGATNHRQITQERHFLLGLLGLAGEYPADHDGFTIGHQDLGVDLVLANGRHAVHLVGKVRFVLGHDNFHDHLVVRSDLRGHFQGQHCLGKGGCGSTTGAGFLIGNVRTLEDLRGFLVGSDYLGLGDDLAVTGALHRRQLQIKDGIIRDETDTDARSRTQYTHVDKGDVQRDFGNTHEASSHVLHRFGTEFLLTCERIGIDILPLSLVGVINDIHASISAGTAEGIEAATQVHVSAPTHTQRLVKTDVGFHDTRLDHHLTHRDIQLGNDAAQLVQALLGFQSDDAVGT